MTLPKDEKFDADAAVKAVKETIEQPDKFAEVFCNAAKSQVKIKDIFREEIQKSISTDIDCKNSLKDIIKQVEKENLFFFGKKIGWGIWTIFIWILATITQILISKYIK